KGENKGYVAVVQDVKKLQNHEKKIRTQLLGDGFVAKYTFDNIVHISAEMQKTISIAKKFSAYNSSVLIQGSSGVGKELFAQSIHNVSERRIGPFVAVNCAALPPSLIESELFGYEEGAFTGSKKGGRAGVFEMAHKGTIFLDEISELPLDIQGRLLRVIQEKEVMRLGDNKVIPLDIRIITATNRNLRKMVSEGKFREDLLFRINTLVFSIPTLNERREDIPILSQRFLEKYRLKYDKAVKSFSKSAMKYLMDYPYEGNVRELENLVERAVIICETETVHIEDFNDIAMIMIEKRDKVEINSKAEEISIFDKGISLKELENKYITHVLNKCKGS
ncbi:MAG: sigma-54 interaction domain-containing protein, partial [Anaerotignaceae bacterium]